jgi:hypothetical protein
VGGRSLQWDGLSAGRELDQGPGLCGMTADKIAAPSKIDMMM